MDGYEENVERPLSEITGPLLGDCLLPVVKERMLQQKVFRQLFGEKGERIYVKELPSINDTIIPLLEMHWTDESWQSKNTRVSGTVEGTILLPPDLIGRTDRFRPIVAAFMRWINSKNDLFDHVPGLIEFGKNANFKYDGAIRAGGDLLPMIEMTLPVLFDMQLFRLALPDIDLDAALDAPRIPDIFTYSIKITDEKLNVLIPTGTLLTTKIEDRNDG